jgi:osmotically-inducible protein OsmY
MDSREPEYVVGHLQDALAHDPRVNELGVTVAVRGNRLFLTGTVPTAERRDGVGAVAAELAPQCDVVNEIAVGSYPEADVPEVLS